MSKATLTATPGQARPQIGAPELTCYRLWPGSPELVPSSPERDWMDATRDRFAYRCIPLSMANASGWEIALPFALEAVWYGGDDIDAIQFRDSDPRLPSFAASHFGHGIITFHTGWLLRTSPGWAIWARGAPNAVKEGIVPLDGLVETDWLPFPFTMNWKFLRPGVVRFEAGEPFCFVTLVPHGLLDAVQPRIATLEQDPKLKSAYESWTESRTEFAQRLKVSEEAAVAAKWQRTYVQGRGAPETAAPEYHLTKRRLKPPR